MGAQSIYTAAADVIPAQHLKRAPVAFFWGALFIPAHWVLFSRATVGWGAISAAVLHGVLFWAAALMNPGCLRLSRAESANLQAQGVQGALCEHCGVLRIVRSKHDANVGACVGRFDHYCAWINNAVGQRNHVAFLALLVMQWVDLAIGVVLLGTHFRRAPADAATICVLAFCVLALVADSQLLRRQLQQIGANLTTNEASNYRKYFYLWRSSSRHFFNPFDRGLVSNWMEFFDRGTKVVSGSTPDWCAGHIFSVMDIANSPLREELMRRQAGGGLAAGQAQAPPAAVAGLPMGKVVTGVPIDRSLPMGKVVVGVAMPAVGMALP